MKITKIFEFSAAHYIPNHPKCGAMHGHNYKVEVILEGKVDPETGMIRDFGDIKEAYQKKLGNLDHSNLNYILKIPTVENLAEYIYKKLKPELKELSEIKVWETETAYASFAG